MAMSTQTDEADPPNAEIVAMLSTVEEVDQNKIDQEMKGCLQDIATFFSVEKIEEVMQKRQQRQQSSSSPTRQQG